jgi:hypothetical protein
MSGYLAVKLIYWMALLGVLGVLLGTYLVFTRALSEKHPLRKLLELQNKKGYFLLAQKVAIGLLMLSLLVVVALYG